MDFSAIKSVFDDSTLTLFTQNQLQATATRLYEKVYPELLSKVYLPPIEYLAAPGDNTYMWRQKTIAANGMVETADATIVPESDVGVISYISGIRTVQSWFSYTTQDLRAAQKAGMDIDFEKADAAKRGIEQTINQINWFGYTGLSIPGFLTNPAVQTITTLPNGNWIGNTSITADQILLDMNTVADTVFNKSLGNFRPTTLMLPLPQYRKAYTLRLSNTGETAAEFFLQKSGMIKEILPLNELAGAGNSGTDRMVAFVRDPSCVGRVEPLPFLMHNPQYVDLKIKTPCEARVGGVITIQPLSVCFGDGI